VKFDNGTICELNNALPRSTEVHISCDPEAFGLVIKSVTEPTPCVYVIEAVSNEACATAKGACGYQVEGHQYDLSDVPVLTGVFGDRTQWPVSIDLCKMQTCQTNTSGFICQTVEEVGKLSLGSTRAPIANPSLYEATLEYSDGTDCEGTGTGPRRSTVHVLCGKTNAFVNGTEPFTCTYDFYVTSPAACPTLRSSLTR
jgi:hypothetical protein